MIETNAMVDFNTIANLPYPGKIFEGAVKIWQNFSNCNDYPQLLNIWIESETFMPD